LNPSPDAVGRMSRREFIVLISMLSALTALATDMMLPAFGDVRAEFGLAADSSAVAPVVTAFFIGFGAGQLLWGPLSDALGRKRVLSVGLVIYVLGALGAVLAPSLASLLLLRLLGGLGAAAVRVVAQGAVRDRFRGDEMAKVLSYVMAVFILVPTVAPTVGVVVLALGSWRGIFLFFALFALAAALWSLRMPETLPPARRLPLDRRRIRLAFGAVVTSRFAMGLTLAQMAIFGFFASYLASSELIIGDVFGLGSWFPFIFGAGALVIGAGILANPRLIDRVGLRSMVRYVISGNLIASVAFALIAAATGGRPPFWLYVAGLLPLLLAHAFVVPNLNAAAMMPMGNIAGTAAAVIGSVVTLGGALIGSLIDRSFDSTITPFAVGGLVCAVAAYACYRWADATWTEAAGRELAAPERALAESLPAGPDPT
jgi:DHA1 family bicyclomycin/chloramphenicol resistance-like MFS transporter